MYSEVVDSVLQRTGALEQIVGAQKYVNMTIRELCTPVFFHWNLVEDTIETGGTSPFVWPRPARLQKLQTMMGADGEFPEFVMPGRRQKGLEFYYYAASTYYTIVGAIGDVHVAYYQFPRKLTYYAAAARPAVYSFETEEWTYHADYDVNDTTRENARNLVSNWILSDWMEMVEEGAMAKVFRSRADEFRASTHFALYEKIKGEFYKASPHLDIAA